MEPRTIKSIVAFLSPLAREGSNLDKFDNKILLASSYLMHSKKKCVGFLVLLRRKDKKDYH